MIFLIALLMFVGIIEFSRMLVYGFDLRWNVVADVKTKIEEAGLNDYFVLWGSNVFVSRGSQSFLVSYSIKNKHTGKYCGVLRFSPLERFINKRVKELKEKI